MGLPADVFPSLFIFIVICVAAAMTGALFKPDKWYRALTKPAWNPPDFAFPIAWTVLYAMIAVAGWMVWRAAEPGEAVLPLTVYGVQLVLNAAWSPLFFGLKRMGWALAGCGALWLSIAATIALFLPVNGMAALILLPYLAWVSFAFVLNWKLMVLNPDNRPVLATR